MFATTPRRLALGLLSVVALACGGDSGTGPGAISGSYALASVNGHALPYVLLDTVEDGFTEKVEVVSPSTLLLSGGSDFRMIITIRVAFAGLSEVQADTISGKYTLAGSAITLTPPGQSPLAGTWNMTDQITFTGDGDVLVFRRN